MSSGPRPSDSPFQAVAILGLGVMGGSLARALSEARPEAEVRGWSPDADERAAAREAGVVGIAPSRWEEVVEGADLVMLAMPLEACRETVRALPSLILAGDATLSDVASLKTPIEDTVRGAGLATRWVGSHPMAGSEGSGFGRARADLFREARVWLVAGEGAEARVPAVERFWRDLGAEPELVGADAHDRSMALVSHLPQLVANALAAELQRHEIDPRALGPGGRDATRLAASAPAMWRDLLAHTPMLLSEALAGVAANLVDIAGHLEAGDLDEIEAIMRGTRAWREGAAPREEEGDRAEGGPRQAPDEEST